MASGERHSKFHMFTWLRQPFSSLWTDQNCSPPDENPVGSDVSDACSDSGSERDDNSRNVVRWLESLPRDQHWCEAEEQIGAMSDDAILYDEFGRIGDAILYNGLGRIGDADVRSTTKNFPSPETQQNPNYSAKKGTKRKKNRRSSVQHISTNEKSRKKKTLPRSAEKSVTSKKIPRPSATIIATEERKNEFPVDRPFFRKPEVARTLEEAMTRAINRYKRNERSWESAGLSSDICLGNYEPPTKRTKPHA